MTAHSLKAQISFTETSNTFDAITWLTMDAGDVEGDGDIDLIVTGNNGTANVTEIYVNDGSGNYSLLSGTNLPYYINGSADFIDMEGDNDLDVLVTGIEISPFAYHTDLYQNDGANNFTLVGGTPFSGVASADIEVMDMDGDNDEDVFIMGTATLGIDKNNVYLNDGSGNFTKYNLASVDYSQGDASLGDIDGDNDIDILMTGNNSSWLLFKNNGGGNFFSTSPFGSPGLSRNAFFRHRRG